MVTFDELAVRVAALETRDHSIAASLGEIITSLQHLKAAVHEQGAKTVEIQATLAEHGTKLEAIMARADRGRSALLPRRRQITPANDQPTRSRQQPN
jgi:hypothetical protein